MADEIIKELWKIKDGIACEHAYNVDSLVAHLKAKGLSAGQKFVDLCGMKTAGATPEGADDPHGAVYG